VRRVAVPLGWGRRLVLVSDLHADAWSMPAEAIRDVVLEVNRVPGVSAVLLPGDFVGHELEAIHWCAEELARITAPTFASLGNHDLVFDDHTVRETLACHGHTVLVNQSAPLDGTLWVAGLDSAVFGRPDPAGMLETVPLGAPCVVLGHEPWLATLHRQPLHLAGHTHHGQIRLRPLPLRYLPAYSQPYPEGTYEVPLPGGGSRWVHTGAGVGSTTLPLRIGAPPEIVVIDT